MQAGERKNQKKGVLIVWSNWSWSSRIATSKLEAPMSALFVDEAHKEGLFEESSDDEVGIV